MPDVSAIVVNYRSSAEAQTAAGSLRRGFAESNLAGEIILVDCGSGAQEVSRLEAVDSDRLVSIENRGYSGGVNAGIAASRSPILLLCNADIEMSPGAVRPLVDAVRRPGIGAAAPVQHADPGGRILLPTGFGAGFGRDFAQTIGPERFGAPARFARHARSQWRLWQSGGAAEYLAGSILVTRRDVLDRVGRFDEGFPFEYEETEWEDRLRRAGFELRVVAESRARHAAGTSAARNPETARIRFRSRALYRRRRYGRLGRAVLAWAESRASRSVGYPPAPPSFEARPEFALAVSPNPTLLPFAGMALDRPVSASWLTDLLRAPLYARAFRIRDGEPGAVEAVGA